MLMNSSAEKPRFLVSLVHGTWAPRAPWTLPGSTLREKLKADLRDLGAEDVEFADPPFQWTGRNVHEDRRAASVLLQKRLEDQLATQNPPIQVIIAHSHGGNIALKALGLSPAVCRNTLLVTLATPFLRFERQKADLLTAVLVLRQLADDLKAPLSALMDPTRQIAGELKAAPWRFLLILAAYGAGVLATAALLYFYVLAPVEQHFAQGLRIACTVLFTSLEAQSCERAPFWFWATPGISIAILGGLLLLVDARKKVLEKNGAELDLKTDTAIRRFAYFQPKAPPVQLLVLSSGVDEALGALTGALWVHRANVWGARAVAAIGFLIAIGLAAAIVYAIAELLTEYLGGFAADFGVAAAMLLAVAFAGIIASIIGVASHVVAKLANHMGLGLSDFESGLLTSVKAFRQPGSEIPFTYCRYGFVELLRNSVGWLFHSRVYNHPKAIQKIAEWLVQAATSNVPDLPRKHAEPES